MTVANAQIGDALRKFDLRVDEEEKRYVYFFDTPERDLLEAGIIAWARRIVGDRHNSTVKFRPVDPGALSRRWRKFEGFKIEADASEKGVDKSVSLTRPVKRGLIRRAVEGEGKVRHLFKKEHGDFLSDIGRKAINKALGRDTIDFDTLTIFGPIMAHRWEFCYAGCPWPINSELWVRCDRDRHSPSGARHRTRRSPPSDSGGCSMTLACSAILRQKARPDGRCINRFRL